MTGITIQPVGDAALLIVLGDTIDLATNRQVHALADRIERSRLGGIRECVAGYATLLVHYDPSTWRYTDLNERVRQLVVADSSGNEWAPRTITIPVVYGGRFAPDLEYVAAHCGMSVDEVIRLHSQVSYAIYMMGFTPGFPYLGGMDARLECPRLATPREFVPAGSVGIAGKQTGIYSIDSPGGWRIIGRTPLRLFDLERNPPFLLAPGDLIRFQPIEDLTDAFAGD